jgi:DNA-binding transcriptional MerR regulator
LDQLAARVAAELEHLAMEQTNGQVSAVPDGRTLRYYATLGLLDRPIEVRGRRAYYGERHVLQAVAIKALQAQGIALGEIQQRLTGRSDDELRAVVARPSGARFWRQAPAPAERTLPAPAMAPPPPGAAGDPADDQAGRPTMADTLAPHDPARAGSPPAAGAAGGERRRLAEPAGRIQRAGIDPVAVRLSPAVTLLIEPSREVGPDDIEAIRAAARAHIIELADRGLYPSPKENP